MTLVLEPVSGPPEVLRDDAWHRPASTGERRLLARAGTPLLDVGCGPGRVVAAVAARGLPALGIDAAPAAVSQAASDGVPVLRRSVFDRLPGEGRWRTVVLLDGNVGIGGDVGALLTRCGAMLAPDGEVLVEVAADGSPRRSGPARLVVSSIRSAWFPWAWVDAPALGSIAVASGLVVRSLTLLEGRCFVSLAHRPGQDRR